MNGTGTHGALPGIASDAIRFALMSARRWIPDVRNYSPELAAPGASFVTLERNERLLGCIGTLVADRPLLVDVAEHARAAAFEDPRVPAVTPDDFRIMSVKVSVLSSSEPLDVVTRAELLDALRPGIDGLVIDATGRRTTFLPAVWDKVPAPDEFVAALWQKAGLPADAWPAGLRVARYTTTEYTSPGPRALS